MPYQAAEPAQIVLVGGDCVSGHDFDTGKEIWRAGGWNPNKIDSFRTVPSVVVADDLIVACAPKGQPVMAMKPGSRRCDGDEFCVEIQGDDQRRGDAGVLSGESVRAGDG
jgi:hypothetical protein